MSGGILALDPSARLTGWAGTERRDSRYAIYGHISTAFDGELVRDSAGKIGLRFENFLEARIEVLKPAHIVREAPFIHGGPQNHETIFALMGIGWLIETIAARHSIPCYVADTRAAVRALTGRYKFPTSKAKKRATVAALEMLGFKGITEDEGDALAILIYEEPRLFPEMRLRLVRPVNMPLFAR